MGRTRCTNREICFTECATGADIDECKTHEYCWNPIPPSLECVDCPDTASCIDDQTSNFPVLSSEDCVTCADIDECKGPKYCWTPIPSSSKCVNCPDTASCVDDQAFNFPVLSNEDCVTCAALD